MGEFCALTIGWNLVLSYVVGTSSVAKAWSANIDALIGCKLRAWQVSTFPYLRSHALEDYPDVFAAIIIIVLAGIVLDFLFKNFYDNTRKYFYNFNIIIFSTFGVWRARSGLY